MLILKQFTTLVATTCIELLVQSVNAALPDPRWGHAAVLLRNKYVLILVVYLKRSYVGKWFIII